MRAPRTARAWRGGRSQGQRRITGPSRGSRRNMRWNSDSIVVEAQLEAHPLDARRRRLARRGLAPAAAIPRSRAAPARSPAARRARAACSPRRRGAVRGRRARAAGGATAPRAAPPAPLRPAQRFSRWTSTRNERLAAISTPLPAGAPASPRGTRLRRQHPHQHERGDAGDQAARGGQDGGGQGDRPAERARRAGPVRSAAPRLPPPAPAGAAPPVWLVLRHAGQSTPGAVRPSSSFS